MEEECCTHDLIQKQQPTISITFGEYIKNNMCLTIHRTVGAPPFRCGVNGCENLTTNECGFCLNCHPIYRVNDFPCSIK